jgi:sugar-specific transcriptional regulator TrmB
MSQLSKPNAVEEPTSIFDHLEDFGLSSYEARVFYTMLQRGFSSARDLSNHSEVPFGRIYDVLGSLEDKDLIDIQYSRPKQYAVKDPKYAIQNLLHRKKQELDALTRRAEVLENDLAKMYIRNPEDGLFWSVALDPGAISRHLGKIAEAEETLIIYADVQIQLVKDTQSAEGLLDLLGSLRELTNRGVTIKVLLGGVTESAQLNTILEMIKDYPVFSRIPFRITSRSANSFDVIDGEKVLLKISNPVKPTEYFAAIYVWQKTFATELQQKFQQMWDEAEETLAS